MPALGNAVEISAPLIALSGAILLYFWQRKSDRELVLANELRQAYADFFSHLELLINHSSLPDGASERAMLEAKRGLNRIMLLSPSPPSKEFNSLFENAALLANQMVLSTAKHAAHSQEREEELAGQVEKEINRCMNLARGDLFGVESTDIEVVLMRLKKQD